MNLDLLKKTKKEKRMTLQQISDLSGVPKRTVDQVFSGKTTNPRIDTVQAIERALGISGQSLEWTEEDRAAGVVDSVKMTLDADEVDWLYLRDDIIRVKGVEFFHALRDVLQIVVDTGENGDKK